jgi:hypothetical protein
VRRLQSGTGMRIFACLVSLVLAGACSSSANPPAVDASADVHPDSSPDVQGSADAGGCPSCAADEMCLVKFDGTCRLLGASCVKKTSGCQAPSCSAATTCNADLCGFPQNPGFSCQSSCPQSTQYQGAMFCYGV